MEAGHCAYHFATNQHSGQTFIETATAGFEPGLKLELTYSRRCFFASISYLGWGSTNFAYASRNPLEVAPDAFILFGLPPVPLEPAPGWIDARARLRYILRQFDLRVGTLLHKGCDCSFGAFVNLRYLTRLEQKQRLTARARIIDQGVPVISQACFEQNASYCGVGIGTGLTGESKLWRCLSIGGDVNATILPGTRKLIRHRAGFDAGFANPNTMVNFCDFNTVIPVLEFRTHVIWPWEWSCAKGTLEIGYEFHQFWQAIAFTKEDDDARVCQNVTVLGPYFGARIAF
jgi:Legionella pneumophila major outer membrane protein precursor